MTDWLSRTEGILRDNGLTGWRAEASTGKRTIGLCMYSRKVICISKHHMENDSPEEVMDTIYHEVAHALTPGKGHGSVWRKTAISLGGTGDQYHTHGEKYPSKWKTMCINGHSPKIYRWNKRTLYVCKCGSPVYITRSDGTREVVGTWYREEFNRQARDRNTPPIDQYGLPLL